MLRINCNGTGCFCLSLYAIRVKVISFYVSPVLARKCAFQKPDWDVFWPSMYYFFPKDDMRGRCDT